MAPPRLHAVTDPIRAAGEYATSFGLMALRRRLPQGTGDGVVVLPGFLGGDGFTRSLRRLLASIGHDTHGWELGRNLGPTDWVVEQLPIRLKEVAEATGGPVALVGHSLGGVYARALAAEHPHLVRAVVTLGTPVKLEGLEDALVRRIFDLFSDRHLHLPPFDDGIPLEVPVTAVHTRTDGIVPWQSCLVEESPTSENLRVAGSHIGLPFNPAAVWVVADRLAQPPGAWRPLEEPAFTQGLIRSA